MRHSPLLVLALTASALAQVPFGYLVTAETGTTTGAAGLRFVDPLTGVATDVRPGVASTRLTLSRAATVTVDEALPVSIPFVPGVSTSIAPTFQRATVQGNEHTATTNHSMTGALGLPNRLQWTSFGMLAAIGNGTQPGLWQTPPSGGPAVRLAPLAAAFDVAVAGNFAYVNSYGASLQSQIEEVDLLTNTVRTVGTTYPAFRALFALPGIGLYAGTDTGALLLIDPVSGAILSSRNLTANPILALAGGTRGGTIYALTDASEVYDIAGSAVPVYRSTQRVNDIAFGNVDLSSFLVFGTGCASTVAASRQAASGLPNIGNAAFAVLLLGGRPSVPAVFVFGQSRTTYLGLPLPLALDFLSLTGCSLYTDVIVTAGLSLDAGGGGRVPLAIPNAPRLAGTHFTTQWFSGDPLANPPGLGASNGGEIIVR